MSIPSCIPLPTPYEMALWDQETISDFGLRQEVLMECAGRGCFDTLTEQFESLEGLRALVLAGSGNNGGDAFVIARLLADAGALVSVIHTGRKKRYRGAAATNLRLAQRMGLPMTYLSGPNLTEMTSELGTPDIIIDGLLGTGFTGELRGNAQHWINAINGLGQEAYVLAVDIPSGLNGENGRPQPVAVMADCTVTFHAPKLGLLMPGADVWTGEIIVHPIGIPGFIERSAPPTCALLTHGVGILAPLPDEAMHKGHAGHVLVMGGSPGLTGAPLLAALGALRAGAGLTTVACPRGLAMEIKAGVPEVMTLPLGKGDAWMAPMADDLLHHIAKFSALSLGPGIGRDERTLEFLDALLEQELPPLVLDADGLYWLAEQPELLGPNAPQTILTPHPGEMARLLGRSTADIQANRLQAAREAADTYGAITILKGAGTVIAQPGGQAWLSPFSSPNLAVAGSGDVLSGLLSAMLAQDLTPLEAACLGVYWHGLAGERLANDYPLRGNLAGDIALELPQTLEELIDADS
ncbi:NAD(P)H-hydrate dehydratase [Desulfovibrio ferrophilus]|uniref:Bifunctional NAD(P)H-hydrate repair enzyme n=1 Tax=Desulfovibrio ferrophilus TaxID=241368 RepID=A0A2Z6AWL3_9BACT|nr:NAD(P)H-hydrate dehydratase [Desulfovibrio ferrophilus]BBD07610.1 carbohydrate kinase, YjeF related protein [Desulfovibrio ferrophilus]